MRFPEGAVLFVSLRLMRERKRQTLVSVLGVAVGVTAFIVMSSLMFGLQRHFVRQVIDLDAHISVKQRYDLEEDRILRRVFGREVIFEILGSRPREVRDRINGYGKLIEDISKMEGVLGVAPHLRANGVVRFGPKEKPVNLVGIDPTLEGRATSIERFLEAGNLGKLTENRKGVILGKLVARDLGVNETGKKVILIVPGGGSEVLEVVDFFSSGVTNVDRSRVYVHLRTLQRLTGRINEVNELLVKVRDVEDAVRIARRIEEETGYDAVSWQEAYSNFLNLFKVQKIITYMVTGSILVVSAFGIFNILMMTVLEKRREIAILKATGFSQRDITFIFLIQGVLIGVLGTLLGFLSAYLVQMYLLSLEIDLEGFLRVRGFSFLDRSPVYYLSAFLFALLLSWLASFYPSKRASSLDPVEIFRSGGV
ncbi:MAG: ABC transporter permease [Aquificota bacterium]|nr:ABC transporter permease [Aquificota bacterium]